MKKYLRIISNPIITILAIILFPIAWYADWLFEDEAEEYY